MRSAIQVAQLQMDFVASVSHELRTPLTAILTAGENIRDGLASSRERLFEQGSVITDQANQLMALVDQVLLFSARKQGRLTHLLREVHASDVIDDALRSTQSLIEEERFSIETRIEPNLPPMVADISVLSQCIQNLIVNAVKYSGTNRWIGVSARMDRDKHAVLMAVQDRGMGISESDLKRIFEPFYRSPQVVSARIRGTGLGLSIAKRSAELFGGQLTVSTQVGVGSVFTVHLPVAEAAREKTSSAESAIGGARA